MKPRSFKRKRLLLSASQVYQKKSQTGVRIFTTTWHFALFSRACILCTYATPASYQCLRREVGRWVHHTKPTSKRSLRSSSICSEVIIISYNTTRYTSPCLPIAEDLSSLLLSFTWYHSMRYLKQ